jgi:hypothetical protein
MRSDSGVQARKCAHCARQVRETIHGRDGARVDFFRTLTGVPRVETLEDRERAGQTLRVLRVDTVVEIVTCRDCFADERVQAALAEARRTGSLPRA